MAASVTGSARTRQVKAIGGMVFCTDQTKRMSVNLIERRTKETVRAQRLPLPTSTPSTQANALENVVPTAISSRSVRTASGFIRTWRLNASGLVADTVNQVVRVSTTALTISTHFANTTPDGASYAVLA